MNHHYCKRAIAVPSHVTPAINFEGLVEISGPSGHGSRCRQTQLSDMPSTGLYSGALTEGLIDRLSAFVRVVHSFRIATQSSHRRPGVRNLPAGGSRGTPDRADQSRTPVVRIWDPPPSRQPA